MKVHDRYTYTDLETVFGEMDLLVVPSIWPETFGYVVLEALSYGVPVLMSGHVGARDILAQGAGMIIEDITIRGLFNVLRNITSGELSKMNQVILEKQEILTMDHVAGIIEERCYH